MSIELVSFDTLKSLLDLEKSAITDYPGLSVIRDSVTSAFETFLGRKLESKSRSVTMYIEGFPTSMIRLDAIPVSSISSFTVTVSDDSETYDVNDDYEITGYGVKLYQAVRNAKIDITYTGGISTVPDDMERAALLQIAYEFQSKEQIGAESVSTEGGFVKRPQLGLLSEVKRLLSPLKHYLEWN